MSADAIDMSLVGDTGWYHNGETWERILSVGGNDVTLSARDTDEMPKTEELAIAGMSAQITKLYALMIALGGGVGAMMEGIGDDG